MSWKGTTARELLKSSTRSLLIAGAAVAVALFASVRDIEPLLFVAVTAFGFDMNLRAVVRKARAGTFGGAGGYVAHAGVAIMLLGVVLSGFYAVSQRVALPKNRPVSVNGYKMMFTAVIPPTETSKQAMEVQVTTPRGKTFWAYPKMYINTRTNQLMANPSIRNSPLFDLYISPQEYDPGSAMQLGKSLTLRRGQSARVGPADIRFDDLQMQPAPGDDKTVTISAHFTVTADGKPAQTQTLEYVAHMDGSAPNEGRSLPVAGFPGSAMLIQNVVPVQGMVQVNVAGLTSDFVPPTPETLSVDVTHKPMIAFVWGGFYVMMFGALLAFIERAGQARSAQPTLPNRPRDARATRSAASRPRRRSRPGRDVAPLEIAAISKSSSGTGSRLPHSDSSPAIRASIFGFRAASSDPTRSPK